MRNYFTVQSGKNKLYGVFCSPEGREKTPCLILGHGFTGDKNERLLVRISERLLEAGFSSVRFDYAGHGESEGIPEEVTVAQEVNDLKAVLEYVKNDEHIDPEKILLGGHSLGGLVALIAASQIPDAIYGLVLISPALTMFHELAKDLTGENLRQVLNAGLLDCGGFQVGRKMIDECSTIDAFSLAGKIHPKALLIHGEEDRDTPPYISVALKGIWGENAQLHLVPEADHCFHTAKAVKEVPDEIASYMSKLFD